MTLKLQCACGTKFAFEVEPEDGRMPSSVGCPGCGDDMTEAANAALAGTTPADTGLRIAGAAEIPGPGPAPPPATARAAALARARGSAASPAPARPRPAGESPALWRVFQGSLLAAAALLGVWLWYAFIASRPVPAASLTAPPEDPFRFAQLLDRDRLVYVTATAVVLYDVPGRKAVWTAPLSKEEQPPVQRGRGGVYLIPDAVAQRSADGLWVALENKAVKFDLATGKRRAEAAWPGVVDRVEADPDALLALTGAADGATALTRVDLRTGESVTRAEASSSTPQAGGAGALTVLGAGMNPAVLRVRLLESVFVTKEGTARQSRARREATPTLERENLRAADSVPEVARWLAERQGGPVEFDESRYAVSLHRPFGGGRTWAGETVGRPGLFPLGDLDLMAAGTNLTAFNLDNERLWSIPLSYPASAEALEGDHRVAVSRGGRVYFADLGTITALDTRTGAVQWRIPTVGVTSLTLVPGVLYAETTSAGPERIRPAERLRDDSRIQPILMKIEAATGRILWQAERVEQIVPSGRWLYGFRASAGALDEATAALNRDRATPVLSLKRLDPETGRELWVWHAPGAPSQVGAFETRVVLRRQTDLKVLRYVSW